MSSYAVYGATAGEFKSALELAGAWDELELVEDEFGAVLADPDLVIVVSFPPQGQVFELRGAGMLVTVFETKGKGWTIDATADDSLDELCELCDGAGWYDDGDGESGPRVRRCGCGAGS